MASNTNGHIPLPTWCVSHFVGYVSFEDIAEDIVDILMEIESTQNVSRRIEQKTTEHVLPMLESSDASVDVQSTDADGSITTTTGIATTGFITDSYSMTIDDSKDCGWKKTERSSNAATIRKDLADGLFWHQIFWRENESYLTICVRSFITGRMAVHELAVCHLYDNTCALAGG